MSTVTDSFRHRNIYILDDFLSSGNIRKKTCNTVKYPLPNEIGNVAEQFLLKLGQLRLNKKTIHEHRRMLSYFITGLELKNINKINDIREDDIVDFIDAAQVNKDHHYNTVKKFCKYLYDHNLTNRNLSYIINKSCLHKQNKLPSFYNLDEIKQIEQSVEQSSYVGKRDYAILLLATRLGLRASDIANISFENFDWDSNKIILTQYKTGKNLELPLLTEVGEAVINYLKFARPKSELSCIFFTFQAPFRQITNKAVTQIISKIIRLSGVDIANRRFGAHSMRHSLASRLLNNGISLPIISESLGHTNIVSTMDYLRIDINSLVKCCLEVPIVATDFYNQRGGIFYETLLVMR
ncbi:MAG: site-specific integrase [Rikenellaceae bacterium]